MWGVPIDHEYFKSTNSAQWLWYYYNSIKDRDNDFTNSRTLLEYHAGFLEPELVNKVRASREEESKKKSSGVIGTTDDKAFSDSVGRLFGRNIDGTIPENTGNVHKLNFADRMAEYEKEQQEKRRRPKYNYTHWTDLELE